MYFVEISLSNEVKNQGLNYFSSGDIGIRNLNFAYKKCQFLKTLQ